MTRVAITARSIKDLFLLCFLGIGTGSRARLSTDGEALTASHVARVGATMPGSWRVSIAEQYALQLNKLNAGAVSLEPVSMPTYVSRPSVSIPHPLISYPGVLTEERRHS